MRVFKKGKFFHYEFEFERQRYQGSTRRKNEREAIQMAAAIQFNVMKEAVGLASKDPAPTIRAFQKAFGDWLDQDIEDLGTREFYKTCYRRLVECNHLSDIRLDDIDEPRIEKFKTWALSLETVKTKTTVNRYLATLSKALHYAADKLKLIDHVPKVHKFAKSKTCERERDFTFTDEQYELWIQAASEPLRSCSIMARNCGMSRNELIALQKDCVHLRDKSDDRGFFGVVDVKRGLKRDSRKRKLPITLAMRDALVAALAQSKCKQVLTSPESPTKPTSPHTLEDQIKRTRAKLELPSDAGLHTLRHTFLTRAGKLTQNVKALQMLAGHSNIATTMRYVHPEQADVFGIVASMSTTAAKLGAQPDGRAGKRTTEAKGAD